MTDSQRAQVVELLRCAADLLLNQEEPFPRLEAAHRLVSNGHTCRFASEACEVIGGPRTERVLLEAAARVEEKSYP